MTVREGVKQYIKRKHALGFGYESTEEFFSSFCKHLGEIDLSELRTDDVAAFLNRNRSSSSTWHQHFEILRLFFRFMEITGKLAQSPLPTPKPLEPKTFISHIYSREQIRALTSRTLLKKVFNSADLLNVFEPETFRTFLLLLYGTGVTVFEALNLSWAEVDFRRNVISVTPNKGRPTRIIPIGRDVRKLLMQFRSCTRAKGYCFATKHGGKIARSTLVSNFRMIRDLVGIVRPGGRRHQARMHDFRHTFAAHRITSWYEEGTEVTTMIPALSAYMGYIGLAAIERCLLLTPAHYRLPLEMSDED